MILYTSPILLLCRRHRESCRGGQSGQCSWSMLSRGFHPHPAVLPGPRQPRRALSPPHCVCGWPEASHTTLRYVRDKRRALQRQLSVRAIATTPPALAGAAGGAPAQFRRLVSQRHSRCLVSSLSGRLFLFRCAHNSHHRSRRATFGTQPKLIETTQHHSKTE